MHPAKFLCLLSLVAAGGWLFWSAQRPSDPPPAETVYTEQVAPPELPEMSVGDGPTGTLQRQVQTLEEQNQLLQKENTELRQQLARELEAKTPPPTPESIAKQVADLRQLAFKKPVNFTPLALADILAKVLASTKAQLTDEICTVKAKAYRAMNFVPEALSFREAVENVMANQWTTLYDPDTQEAVYQNDADLRRLDARDLVVAAAHKALIAQNFPTAAKPALESANDDEACALRAFVWGENAFYRVRWALQDDMINLTSAAKPPSAQALNFTPLYFTEQYKFCVDSGKTFTETLLSKSTETGLNAAYQRPPRTTAEILHPELYLSEPPFEPTVVDWGDKIVFGKKPYFENVAGEFTTDMMLRYFMSPDLAIRISDGWAGDSYLVYTGSDETGDHVVWKTQWRTPEDGQEFFEGLRRVLLQRYTIPWLPEFESKTAFVVNDPHRVIRLRLSADGKSVSLVNATAEPYGNALDGRWGVK